MKYQREYNEQDLAAPLPKKERNHRTLTIGSIKGRGTFRDDALRINTALNNAGIANRMEEMFKREGETTQGGKPKIYSLDVYVCDTRFPNIGIELEGKGSASKDNEKRDRFFKDAGVMLFHFPNDINADIVVACVKQRAFLPGEGSTMEVLSKGAMR